MGDWIKLRDRYLNLDAVLSTGTVTDGARWISGSTVADDVEYLSKVDQETVENALEARCRNEDGGLKG